MKTSLWRSVRQTPDAASQVVVDLLDKELANIVQYIAFGDVSAAEADALFEASLGLMQIQLERTGKVPTALMETILRFVISHCTRSEHVAHLLFELDGATSLRCSQNPHLSLFPYANDCVTCTLNVSPNSLNRFSMVLVPNIVAWTTLMFVGMTTYILR